MNSAQGRNTMMSMLDAQPEEQQDRNGEYWGDVSDHLSPIRKHLISTYLQVTDEESMPLLGEYFGVALSFVALGALVRASNSSKRKQKKLTEEERLDLRSCSRFQRMALESMLRESMERLRNLSQNAYQLEERVKHLVAENFAQDRERFELMERLVDADKSMQELLGLRKAEGRANEKVMGIVASKEQDWIKEKRSLQKEVEKLKGEVKTMTREAKLQARRCREPACEHCRGINRGLRMNVPALPKGRISLRDLHSLRDSEAPVYELPMFDRRSSSDAEKIEDDEEDGFLLKSIGLKGFSEKLGQSNADRRPEGSSRTSGSGESSTSGSGLSPAKDGAKEQQDMEIELASILKRVGMLKQRSVSSGGVGLRKEASAASEDNSQLPVDEVSNAETLKDEQLRSSSPEVILPEKSPEGPSRNSFEAAEYASEADYNSVESPVPEDFIDHDLSPPEIPGTSLAAGGEFSETSDISQRSVGDAVELSENAEKHSELAGVQSTEVSAPSSKDLSMSTKEFTSSEGAAALCSESSDTVELGDESDDESYGSKEAMDTEANDEQDESVSRTLGEAGANPNGEIEPVEMDSEDGNVLFEDTANDSAAGSGSGASSALGMQGGMGAPSAHSTVIDTDSLVSDVEKERCPEQNSSETSNQSSPEAKDSKKEIKEDKPVLERRSSDDMSGQLSEGGEEKKDYMPHGFDEALKGGAPVNEIQTAPTTEAHSIDTAKAADHGGQNKGDLHSGDEKGLKLEIGKGNVDEQENEDDVFFDLEN